MNEQLSEINTTRLDIEKLKPVNDERTTYYDKKKKGFLIEATNEGLVFFYEYKFNKKVRSVLLGKYPSLSLAKALEKWEVAFKKVSDGKDIWLYEQESSNKKIVLEDSLISKDPRVLKNEEIIKFWKGLDSINEISAITRLGLKILLLTGCSKDELFNASWDDINFDYREWIVYDIKKSQREINLSTLAIETFLEIQDFEHHTAYSNNKIKQALVDSQNKILNLSKKSLDRAIDKEGCKKLGINNFTLLDLQSTFNLQFKECGDVEKVGELITNLINPETI